MEDTFAIDEMFRVGEGPTFCVYSVFDGHSGIGAAAICRDRTMTLLRKNMRASNNNVKTALSKTFKELDDEIRAASEASGCTALVCVFCIEKGKKVLYVANCGDCRAIIGGEGRYDVLSNDHTFSKNKPEQQRIRAHPNALVDNHGYVTDKVHGNGSVIPLRTLGDHPVNPDKTIILATPEISRTELDDTDQVVVLATDGLWDTLTNIDAMRMTLAGISSIDQKGLSNSDLNRVAKQLVHEAIRRRSTDNITAVVIVL